MLQKFLDFLVSLFKKPVLAQPLPPEPTPKPLPAPTPPPPVITPRERLYDVAKSKLDTDVTPKDLVDDDVACAECVDAILFLAFGRYVNGTKYKNTVSTYTMLETLINSSDFKEVMWPDFGDIIISATGTSSIPNTPIKNGHVGVLGKTHIMSNNSLNGLWQAYYTIKTWRERYVEKGGYKMRFFRRL